MLFLYLSSHLANRILGTADLLQLEKSISPYPHLFIAFVPTRYLASISSVCLGSFNLSQRFSFLFCMGVIPTENHPRRFRVIRQAKGEGIKWMDGRGDGLVAHRKYLAGNGCGVSLILLCVGHCVTIIYFYFGPLFIFPAVRLFMGKIGLLVFLVKWVGLICLTW